MKVLNKKIYKIFILFTLVILAIKINKIQTKDIESQITNLISQMTLEEKVNMLHGSSMFESPGVERLGISRFHMSDGPHGVREGKKVTAFPTTIALAATWDIDICTQVGESYGREHRGAGTNMALGPTVDIGHDPRNGRASETIGEEPYLGGKLMAAFTRGAQSTKLITCMKHFMAQNHDGDREKTCPIMDERTMREFYGLSFRIVVQEAKPYSIMSSYNLVNNIHTSQNKDILIQMLRNEWGYENFVVSDWWGTYDEASILMNSGLDMEMPDNSRFNGLKEAVNNGKITQDTLNMAIRRTLRARFKSGMMDPNTPKGNPEDINSPKHQKINLEAGKKAMILLKNTDNILPLKKSGKISLIGPNADKLPVAAYGSSEIQDPAYLVTVKQGIKNIASDVEINYIQGCGINDNNKAQFDKATNAAKNSDFVIFVGGLDNSQEGEAYGEREKKDRTGNSVMLPKIQIDLINELSKANSNLIVVLFSGGVVSLGTSVNNIKGLIYAFYCGNECGNAVAQTIFGDNNPAGRMPICMPTGDNQLPAWNNLNFTNDMIAGYGYRRFDTTGEKPIFNFGFGLSYTTFSYANLQIAKDPETGKTGKTTYTVSVDVTNTGKLGGDEVIQLYLTAKVSVDMPKKQLRGFKRLYFNAGETKKITLELSPYELSYWSIEKKHYFVEKGEYTIWVGGSSDNLQLTSSFKIDDDYIIPYGSSCDNCSVESISLLPKINKLSLGKSDRLSVFFDPPNSTNQEVAYESNDVSIVTIAADGIMTPIKVGKTTISCTSKDGGFKDSVSVEIVSVPLCPEWQRGVNYKKGEVVTYKGENYTSKNGWNGHAPNPYTATHSIFGWGWVIGGNCNDNQEKFLKMLE
jgi:beta-glucosidase